MSGGVTVRDEKRIFGKVDLEGFHADLSWLTILHKREVFGEASDFEIERVAQFTDRGPERLLGNAAFLRHKAKNEATIQKNAERA
ncbi:Methyladenine glycosylase [Cupriavidus sp. YR651]|uniref:DNA-3-methyladenine glycosylase I n=1 Tax=Cupriavidus sp. YR651 TaxID=1855315 RepID=UPI00088F2526|nr:DNA-3-methyladenine glycosylase I [Cupriavidus sp. YR651]SDD99239.1 Methyladenine glycosylase [Cupriavidus sp. YR651]